MSPRRQRARSVGCALDRTPGGKLRFRFRWAFPGEEKRQRFAETTALDDTPENRRNLEQVRREIGATIKNSTFDYLKVFPKGNYTAFFAPPSADDVPPETETVTSYKERWLPRKLGAVAPVTYRDY